MGNHITTQRRDFWTWQHNPALSSSAMTHISLSVSCRGGVQNDALAWKIPFEGACWGLTEQPDWGKTSWYCHWQVFFFVSFVGRGRADVYRFSHSVRGDPPCLLDSQFVHPSVDMSQSIAISLLMSRVAVTHQGAVVKQSCGEVVVKTEHQNVSLSGMESHFVFWHGWDNSGIEGCVSVRQQAKGRNAWCSCLSASQFKVWL